jgi:hypothetical protein
VNQPGRFLFGHGVDSYSLSIDRDRDDFEAASLERQSGGWVSRVLHAYSVAGLEQQVREKI